MMDHRTTAVAAEKWTRESYILKTASSGLGQRCEGRYDSRKTPRFVARKKLVNN